MQEKLKNSPILVEKTSLQIQSTRWYQLKKAKFRRFSQIVALHFDSNCEIGFKYTKIYEKLNFQDGQIKNRKLFFEAINDKMHQFPCKQNRAFFIVLSICYI